ncbi:butyrophilin-like protein 2 isoform X2 [Pundamilia nyererei]|uniref:Butyrophilin-like protein 2 isoform X2 n=1 Tax=Pundamilia nyererei TaxID=303518 RepID=A0A9Y6J8D4_9CICH|nr:PREDICTED: butyrophilin-like protein 2 isoform X2 [Pundamilia nyererei]
MVLHHQGESQINVHVHDILKPHPVKQGCYCSSCSDVLLSFSFIYTSENLLLSVFVVLSVIPVKVEVEEGATSVTLPFKTTKNLSGEIQVIWERYEPFQKAHVFTNGQNQYEEQHEVYRGRTVMNEDLLKTGDLSLTLEYPTDADSGEYKCLVWRKGTFIRKKTVKLKVKGPGSNRGHQDQKLLH